MKIGVCGHFGKGKNLANGQTIKTKIVTETLRHLYGSKNIYIVDSHGGAIHIPRIFTESFGMFRKCENIVMMLNMKGLLICSPVYYFYRFLFQRNVHFVVIGGWLPVFLKKHAVTKYLLSHFDGIYVETDTMKQALDTMGFTNVLVMPNFKNINVVSAEEASVLQYPPYKLCTFSRVMKEKGIEEAVQSVMEANGKLGYPAFELDIYGQIDSGYADQFEDLKKKFPEYIRYGGVIQFDACTDILKNYFALLFPTYYEGEGFAGTLIDAMSAGVPVVATDWKYNKEIVRDGITGKVLQKYPVDSTAQLIRQLTEQLISMAEKTEMWIRMRVSSRNEAEKYSPNEVIKVLTDRFDLTGGEEDERK